MITRLSELETGSSVSLRLFRVFGPRSFCNRPPPVSPGNGKRRARDASFKKFAQKTCCHVPRLHFSLLPESKPSLRNGGVCSPSIFLARIALEPPAAAFRVAPTTTTTTQAPARALLALQLPWTLGRKLPWSQGARSVAL